MSRFSPRYANSLPHGRFKPNSMFSLMSNGWCQQGDDSDSGLPFTGLPSSQTLQESPLEFEDGADNPFYGIPTSGKGAKGTRGDEEGRMM
jgi:hypothetical protein